MSKTTNIATAIAVGVVLAALLFATGSVSAQDAVQNENSIDFARDIKPIFEASCVRCHGVDQQEGDFRVDDKDNLLDYVDPGDSEFSQLFELITATDDTLMPPAEEGGPLAAEAIDKIKRWINEGADWPEGVTIDMPPPEVVERIKEEVKQAQETKDKQEGSGQLLLEVIGLLHPVFLHFPVALLIGGAFFAVLGFRGESPMSDAAYYCLWLAAWIAVLTCLSGWYFAIDKNYLNWQSFDFNRSIDIHRWGGIIVSVLTFLLALMAARSRRRDPYGTGAAWKFGLILVAGLTGFVAHHGGKMTHVGLHEKLQNKTTILYENLTGNSQAEPAKDDESKNEKPAAHDASQIPAELPGEVTPTPGAPSEGSGETSEDEKDKNVGQD